MNLTHVNVSRWWAVWEISLIVLLFFIVAGDPPPGINEAHYLIKAKHYWDEAWLANDLFASSGNAHTTFFAAFGWLTRIFELSTTAWIGRFLGWVILAAGLYHFCKPLFNSRYSALAVASLWVVATEYGNLAGEWVVGGIESKVFAYGFLLFALGQILRGRWGSAWVLLGTASAFHVLVGGWSVVIAMFVRLACKHPQVKRVPPIDEWLCLVLGGAISLFGLLPSLGLGKEASPEEVNIAAHLYVYGRLSHHLNPASLEVSWYVRHGLLVIFTLLSSKYLFEKLDDGKRAEFRIVYLFALGAMALAVVGLGLGVLPAIEPTLGAKLLRFYWFRMTDSVTPLAAAVTVTGMMTLPSISIRYRLNRPKLLTALASAVLVVCLVMLAKDFMENVQRNSPAGVRPMFRVLDAEGKPATAWSSDKVYEDWLEVTGWIRESTPQDAVFLTPRHQHSFKWYAQRAEFVNWKDVPQDATSLIEWARRFNLAFPQIESRRHPTPDTETLKKLADQYGIEFLVVDRRVFSDALDLNLVYPLEQPDEHVYWVYRF